MINHCHVGDVRDILPTLPAESVQTCVTSPPYWGLRDYGTGTWDGGDPDCSHIAMATGGNAKQGPNKGQNNAQAAPFRDVCGHCGAARIDNQLGLEPTPEAFVTNMVEVFAAVRRVLKPDGTLWLNLGDSYASNPASGGIGGQDGGDHQRTPKTSYRRPPGLKPKDLCGMPWRVAFALQADGWYLRQDIIWHKPNPMPESVTDRCTSAHEYLFLLSRSAKYYYDADAIREPHQPQSVARAAYGNARQPRGWHTDAVPISGGKQEHVELNANGANRRSVWTVASQPYADAHFATFPRKLIEPCILAGSRTGDTVLDPFMGSGTTAQVAQDLGRQWIGCELNPEYVEMQHRRTAQQALPL